MIKIAANLKIENLSKPIIGKLHHAHCSSIVHFEDGELVVVYYHAIKEANHNQQIFITRKLPGDSDWTEPKPIPKTSKRRFDGNPALWIAPDTGLLWLFYSVGFGWSVCWPKYRVSKDRGYTWSEPKSIYPFISRGIKNPPILTSKGYYVLPCYVEFKHLRGVFFISKDQGKTWKQSNKVDLDDELVSSFEKKFRKLKGRQLEQPTLIERSDGTLYALFRNHGQNLNNMLESESYDGGFKWTKAKLSALPNPAAGFFMKKLINANDNLSKSKEVGIIYNHAPSKNNERKWRNPLSFAISLDEARTWKYRRNLLEWHSDEKNIPIDNIISQDYNTFEYPTFIDDNKGNIHANWSFSYSKEINGKKLRFMDIQYTKFPIDWVKQKEFFNDAWELI